jgi:hypothetical protein
MKNFRPTKGEIASALIKWARFTAVVRLPTSILVSAAKTSLIRVDSCNSWSRPFHFKILNWLLVFDQAARQSPTRGRNWGRSQENEKKSNRLDTGGGAACYNRATSSLEQFLAQPIWEEEPFERQTYD